MKICIVCTSYPRSKDDYWVPFMHSWARELAKTEEVTVVTSGSSGAKDYEVRDNVKIYRFNYFFPKKLQRLTYTGGMRESFKREFLPKIQAPFFLLFFLLKTFKIAKKCDVINSHWVLSGLVSIPVKVIYGKPIVLTEHGGSLRGLPKWLNKWVLRRMDMITSAHYDMIKSIENMGINNVVDVKNFLNEEKFVKKHNKKSIKDWLKIKEKYVATFIGRFEELKDPLTFVEAVSYASTKLNHVKFVMVGDGHLKSDIEKKVKSLGLEKVLFLSKPTQDVDKFLAISDAFIACSATENCFSTTILEAMLSKVPCIITKAGMTKKFFVHKQDAYLVEKKNPKALGDAIIKVLGESKLRKKLSENGMEFLERYGFRNRAIRQKIVKTLKTVSRT